MEKFDIGTPLIAIASNMKFLLLAIPSWDGRCKPLMLLYNYVAMHVVYTVQL